MISSIANLVHELPHELPNDLRLRILAMRLKHFLKLKEKANQETWIILMQYNPVSILYRLDKNFKYMISSNTIKTEKNKY